MCNLYANVSSQEAMRAMFKLPQERDRLGNQAPLSGIWPAYPAPVLRLDDDGKPELVSMNWGFIMRPFNPKTKKQMAAKAVNNARDDKLDSNFWSASFRDRRCLVPATSFCETQGRKPAIYHWLGIEGDGDRPLFAFAGIWRDSKGKVGKTEIDGPTHSIVTSGSNELVEKIHGDRLVVLLHTDDHEQWLHGTEKEARELIRPFPAEKMQVFKKGEDLKSDAA